MLGWGDSLGVGVGENPGPIYREAQDIDWPGVYQVRQRAPIGISADITPLDQAQLPTGNSNLSPYEYFGKQRQADVGANIYLVPHNWSGTSFGASGWGVGNTLHEAFIARCNSAIQAVLAVEPTAVVDCMIAFMATNPANAGSDPAGFKAAMIAADADMRARIFKNGVSGPTIADVPHIFCGMHPIYLNTVNRTLYEQALRAAAQELTHGRFYAIPEGRAHTDNTHFTLNGSRLAGTEMAQLRTDTTAPVMTGIAGEGDYTCFEGQKMLIELSVASGYAYWTLSGAGAADFEIVTISDGTSGINLGRMRQYLRWAGDGTKTPGSYTVTLNAEDGAGNVATQSFTVTVAAAYGTQVGAITATNQQLFSGTITNDVRSRAQVPVTLGAGLNVIIFNRNTGSAADISSVTFNGIVATRDPSSTASNQIYYLPIAEARTGTLLVAPTSGTFASIACLVTTLTGTVASPDSSSVIPNAIRNTPHETASLTCPANGIIVGGGLVPGRSTGTAGQTLLASSGNIFVATRTTTGAIGSAGTNGFSWLGAAAFAKAV